MDKLTPEQQPKLREREQELLDDIVVLEKYIEDFWDILPAPTCITNPIFNVLETGHSFNVLFGYEKNELVGGFLGSLFKDEKEFEELSSVLVRKRRAANIEVVLSNKAGRQFVVLASSIAREDSQGEIVGYLFSFQDITLRRRAEQELKEKIAQLQTYTRDLEGTRKALLNILEDAGQERQRAEKERDRTLAIIRNFADGLVVIESEKITLFNPKAVEFFQDNESKVVGQNIWQLASDPRMGLLVKLLKEQGFDFSRKEISFPEGMTVEVSTVPVMKQGRRIGSMVILHNVSREKFIEQMKTEFVSIAAHQLRTPISAIKWILNMLMEGDLGQVNNQQKDYLKKAFLSNERMIRLINDLLNVTRIEEGRFLYNVSKGDLVKLVEKSVGALKAAAQRKGLKFKLEKPQKRAPAVYLDNDKIALAVQNLVDNAIHYTEKGSISILINYFSQKKEFVVEITDTGIGIPKEQQERVFSRFFRAGNAIRAETSGTGLGLFIAKNIIEAHQGKIWFKSVLGKGSAFYFSLPVKTKAQVENYIESF